MQINIPTQTATFSVRKATDESAGPVGVAMVKAAVIEALAYVPDHGIDVARKVLAGVVKRYLSQSQDTRAWVAAAESAFEQALTDDE